MRGFQTVLAVLVITCVALTAEVIFAQEKPAVALPAKENFHLFLLVGQSNMAGRGDVAEADRAPHPRVLVFNKARQWAPAADPLHFDKPNLVGVGPGKTFAEEIAQGFPDITVGLIPCAVGGSPISAWEPGALYAETNSHPWDDALARALAALPAGTLKGILWHQGESDSKPELSAIYPQKLKSLVERFRQDLAAPDVPFLAGQLGRFPAQPWDEHRWAVDAAHRQLPKVVPLTAFVSAEGLEDKLDGVHFNAAACRELGRRYAKSYLEMAGK